MNTTDKLAKALTLGLECANELLAEKRQALAGHPEKVAPYQEMVDYLRRELAAHEQAQAALRELECPPDPETVDRALAQAGEPVAYMRDFWGPDCGPYYEIHKTADMVWRGKEGWTPLYTTPQPALAQHREPLTDAEIEEILHGEIALNPGDGCAGRFARAIERAHGIGATTGEQR